MTTDHLVTRVDHQFSLAWIKNHPQLFSERFAAFVEKHPSDQWNHRVDYSIPGQLIFVADRKPAELAIHVSVGVKWGIVTNAIIGAIEGGSAHWCEQYEYGHTPDAVVNPKKYPLYACEDFWIRGGIVNFKYQNYEDGPEIGTKHLSCNTLAWGLGVMAEKYPRHFGNLIHENDDAETHDVLLQCALFGETIFG